MEHGVLDFLHAFHSCESELVRVLRELDASKQSPMPEGDLRSEPRIDFERAVPVGIVFKTPGAPSRAYPAYLRDLSMHGASVIHAAPEDPGTRVTLTVPFGPGEPLRISGVVVRTRGVLERFVEVGIRLTTPVDIESIRQSGRLG
jgi:hypothetical protein